MQQPQKQMQGTKVKALIPMSILVSAMLLIGCGPDSSDKDDDPKTPTTPPTVTIPWDTSIDPANVSDVGKSGTQTLTGTETKTLVILVSFADQPLQKNAAYWSSEIFGKEFGELNDFMQKNSENKIYLGPTIESAGVQDGVVTVSLPYNHLAPNGSMTSANTQKLIEDSLIEAFNNVDLAAIDTNNDSIISQDELTPLLIIAGQEESFTNLVPSIWAHSYVVANDTFTDYLSIGGYSIHSSYALFGEQHDNHVATIGIMAHELGHAIFGLPDLYNTDPRNASQGIGPFGLMSGASWGAQPISGSNQPGNSPGEMSAWSKKALGIGDIIEINQRSDWKNFYLASNNSNQYNMLQVNISQDEYFLIENMSDQGYMTGLKGLIDFVGGVAIWHINERIIRNEYLNNTVNADKNHKGVDLEEAYTLNLDLGHSPTARELFYKNNKTEFSNSSSPSKSTLDNGFASGVSVKNVSERGVTMSLSLTNKL